MQPIYHPGCANVHCASARQQIPLQNQVIAASTPTLYALQWNGNLSFEEERSSQQMTKRGEMLSEGPRKISLASGVKTKEMVQAMQGR